MGVGFFKNSSAIKGSVHGSVPGSVAAACVFGYHQFQDKKLQNVREVAKSLENQNKVLIGIVMFAGIAGALYLYNHKNSKKEEFAKFDKVIKLTYEQQEQIQSILSQDFSEQYEIYKCPIRLRLMVQPITLQCGHSFEKSAIQEYLQKQSDKCPLCRQTHSSPLRETKTLKHSIEMFRKKAYKRGRQFLQNRLKNDFENELGIQFDRLVQQ